MLSESKADPPGLLRQKIIIALQDLRRAYLGKQGVQRAAGNDQSDVMGNNVPGKNIEQVLIQIRIPGVPITLFFLVFFDLFLKIGIRIRFREKRIHVQRAFLYSQGILETRIKDLIEMIAEPVKQRE